MDSKRGYIYRVEPRDVDFMAKASIMSLVDYLLHVAGEDADRNGFGVRQLNLNNASWVLVRMAVETVRMPLEYEEIRINTWVSGVTRAMTTRNFEVIDARGEMIAYAVTNWTMIDIEQRRMLDLYSLPEYDSMTQDYPSPIALPRKLAEVTDGNRYGHRVSYSDLDFNCHTNSVKYIQWVVDTLPFEVMGSGRIARMDINFLHETRYGDDLIIIAAGNCRFEIRNANGESVCRIAMVIN